MSIESVILSNHLILCCPLLLLSIFPSIRVFCNELALHIRWSKYWSFSHSVSSSNEYSELISFRTGWLVGYPCSPRDSQESCPALQLKASILWCSTFFMVQLSHLYVTTVKAIALTIRTIVGKMMSLLFNTLSTDRQHETTLSGKSKNLTLKKVALTHFSPSICSVSMNHSSGIFDILLESQQQGTTCLMHIHP